MLAAVLIGLSLIGATTAVHYAVLHAAARWLMRVDRGFAATLFLVVYAASTAHLIEAGLYAAGLWLGDAVLNLGAFAGPAAMSAMDYFYFSLINYTTLGLGDIYPTGHLRFIAGVEAFNGFLLISCSASFLFLAMRRDHLQAFADRAAARASRLATRADGEPAR